MKRIVLPALFVFGCLLLDSCGTKKENEINNKQEPPIFGTYKHKSFGIATIELHNDSTVTLDIGKKSLLEPVKNDAVHRTGIFSYRNDSIFITWEKGTEIKSKFERKDSIYSFRIGATWYEKKL
jgi:hypothetical protein